LLKNEFPEFSPVGMCKGWLHRDTTIVAEIELSGHRSPDVAEKLYIELNSNLSNKNHACT